jgi:streptogramin lyase
MQGQFEAARGKIFTHPVTNEDYGPIQVPRAASKFETLDGRAFDLVAADPSGNCFTVTQDGAVWFWDHETDDLGKVSNSVAEFVAHCVVPSPVELKPGQVKSVWMDPAFAKSIGKKVPADGWIKKPSKRK